MAQSEYLARHARTVAPRLDRVSLYQCCLRPRS
jgi:hypothetical protein